jgi:hypothetical protein
MRQVLPVLALRFEGTGRVVRQGVGVHEGACWFQFDPRLADTLGPSSSMGVSLGQQRQDCPGVSRHFLSS